MEGWQRRFGRAYRTQQRKRQELVRDLSRRWHYLFALRFSMRRISRNWTDVQVSNHRRMVVVCNSMYADF